MPACIDCGKYAKYPKGYCSACYKLKNSGEKKGLMYGNNAYTGLIPLTKEDKWAPLFGIGRRISVRALELIGFKKLQTSELSRFKQLKPYQNKQYIMMKCRKTVITLAKSKRLMPKVLHIYKIINKK